MNKSEATRIAKLNIGIEIQLMLKHGWPFYYVDRAEALGYVKPGTKELTADGVRLSKAMLDIAIKLEEQGQKR